MIALLWTIPLFPLAGALALGVLRSRLSERTTSVVACAAVALSFVVAAGAVVEFASTRWNPETYTVARSDDGGAGFPRSWEWIPGGSAVESLGDNAGAPIDGGLSIGWVYQLDALTAVMLLVVTGIGFLIHVFAVGYMHGDSGFARFFSYLNLFMFSMLVLVLAANLPMLFVGWEGVGLCSYLLIGFWYEKPSAADAAKKAFLANRIGDAGFLLGIFAIFALFGTLDFTQLRAIFDAGGAAPYGEAFGEFGVASFIALALFVGVAGKSAQIPLFVWLPDAMAGPTPVSALIHAATMVTAGVYLLARLNFIFTLSPTVMCVVAVTGAMTALVGAMTAVSQTDIKKVLAYSTVSQLGFMVLACGAGAFSTGIFHVATHACFKALLFLGAGSIIHAIHHEQDLTRMGGLRRFMPTTWATMAVGAVALAGIFPFAGFFSKDAILWDVWASPVLPSGVAKALWTVGLATAVLTAFYITRLIALAFLTPPNAEAAMREPSESPRIMTIPLVVLAGLSLVVGWVGIGAAVPVLGSHEPPFFRWLRPVMVVHASGEASATDPTEYLLAGCALALSAAGMWLGYVFYVRRRDLPARAATALGGLYRASVNTFWFDDLYAVFPVRATVALAKLVQRVDTRGVDGAVNTLASATTRGSRGSGWFDLWIVDGVVNAIGSVLKLGSHALRAVQSGVVQNYALLIVAAMVLCFLAVEWRAIIGLLN